MLKEIVNEKVKICYSSTHEYNPCMHIFIVLYLHDCESLLALIVELVDICIQEEKDRRKLCGYYLHSYRIWFLMLILSSPCLFLETI